MNPNDHTPVMQDIQPPQSVCPQPRTGNRYILYFVGGIGILIVLLVGVWYFSKKPAVTVTPLEQLQALKEISKPISGTMEERGKELADLQKASAPSTTPSEERIQELDALKNI
jgi:hypothetical protein